MASRHWAYCLGASSGSLRPGWRLHQDRTTCSTHILVPEEEIVLLLLVPVGKGFMGYKPALESRAQC